MINAWGVVGIVVSWIAMAIISGLAGFIIGRITGKKKQQKQQEQ